MNAGVRVEDSSVTESPQSRRERERCHYEIREKHMVEVPELQLATRLKHTTAFE